MLECPMLMDPSCYDLTMPAIMRTFPLLPAAARRTLTDWFCAYSPDEMNSVLMMLHQYVTILASEIPEAEDDEDSYTNTAMQRNP